jgi:endonuclease/exonuclease/phosphatase family metal-dependent hydrolase
VTRLFAAGACGCLALLAFVAAQPPRTARAHPAPGTLRVMSWNVHMGVDAEGEYTLSRIADVIADAAPHLVGVQEISRNHAYYNCDDQPAAIAARLSKITGLVWHHVYVKEWDTRKRECLESGRGDEHETEGLAFFAPEPIQVERVKLPNGRLGLTTRIAAAPGVAVVVTHLASGAATLKDRVRQIEMLLPWAAGRGTPRILLGDFNAGPDAPEMRPVFADYRDAWQEGSRGGKARGVASGSTRPGRESRIDYVFYTPASGLALEDVEVMDTSSLLGSEASDHRPVVATFRIAEPR